MDVFFSPNGSYHTTSSKAVDKFYGRTGEGKDILTLSGLFNRYEIKFIDKPMGDGGAQVKTWVIKDHLSRDKGGDGEIWATNIDKIDFYGPFDLEIGKSFAGTLVDSNTPADKQVKLVNKEPFWNPEGGPVAISNFKKLGSSGELLSKVVDTKEMFAEASFESVDFEVTMAALDKLQKRIFLVPRQMWTFLLYLKALTVLL